MLDFLTGIFSGIVANKVSPPTASEPLASRSIGVTREAYARARRSKMLLETGRADPGPGPSYNSLILYDFGRVVRRPADTSRGANYAGSNAVYHHADGRVLDTGRVWNDR